MFFWGLGSATGMKRNKHLVRIRKLEFTPNQTLSIAHQTSLLNGETYILEDIDFDIGSAALPETAKPILDKLIRFHKEYPKYTFIIDSYVDSRDKQSNNLDLAKDQAETIARHLIDNGFRKDKIIFYGNRELKSNDLDNTKEVELKKRRIELRMRIIKV